MLNVRVAVAVGVVVFLAQPIDAPWPAAEAEAEREPEPERVPEAHLNKMSEHLYYLSDLRGHLSDSERLRRPSVYLERYFHFSIGTLLSNPSALYLILFGSVWFGLVELSAARQNGCSVRCVSMILANRSRCN